MSFEVGQKVAGKVTGITHFGAFVSLPDNKTGLIHISEISDSYIKDINTVLTVGQEVEVKVLTIAADGKISLSLRQASEQAQAKPETASRPKPALIKMVIASLTNNRNQIMHRVLTRVKTHRLVQHSRLIRIHLLKKKATLIH